MVKPGRERGVVVVGAQRVAGFGPGGEHVPDVGARVAERADLPVEHRADRRRAASTMQLPRRKSPCTTVLSVCGGMRRGEQLVHAVDGRHVARLRRLELRVPPLELTARRSSSRRGEVAEPDRVDVDRVQRDERVDERLARCGRARRRRARRSRCRRRAGRCPRRTTSRRTARRSRRRRRSTRAPRGRAPASDRARR